MEHYKGITFKGHPLEEYIKNKNENELRREIIFDIESQKNKRRFFHRNVKYKEKKGRAERMTKLPQSQINKEYLQKFLEQANGLKNQIVCLLVSGDRYTAEAIIEKLGKFRRYSKQQVWSIMSAIMRSDLADYIKRKKVDYGGIKQFEYWCNEEGCSLTPNEAYELSQQKKGRAKKQDPTDSKIQKTQTKKKEVNLPTAAQILGQTLNIVVSGNVDITFKLKVGE